MKKKMTAHSLTIKHKKAKKMSSEFAKNRHEEEMEQEGKMKHYKHMKHMKKKSAEHMACKHCGSMAHKSHEHKHEKHHTKKKSAAAVAQTQNARFERMRKKVFGLK